jgi:2,5-furandicarboxylate decarboxylase 1
VVPTGAKVGIDATIGEGIPVERFERIAYAYADRAKVDDYVSGKADPLPPALGATDAKVEALAQQVLAMIEVEPRYYQDIAAHFAEYDFQTVARALGHLHTIEKLWQDPKGKMCVRGSKFAAVLPQRGK